MADINNTHIELSEDKNGTSSGISRNHISLSLTAHYARNWGSWEGVRELVQNWHDGVYEAAETLSKEGGFGFGIDSRVKFTKIWEEKYEEDTFVHKKELTHRYEAQLCPNSPQTAPLILGQICYDATTSKLVLTNGHTSLHKRVLLLGYSQKAAKREVIGQFGEGLKIGTLALVREGRTVTMETGCDHWLFELVKDPNFGEKVLTVLVTDHPCISTNIDETEVHISNKVKRIEDTITTVSLEEGLWKRYCERFLFLSPPQSFVETEPGLLLLDDRHQGQMYVKGVWVADMTSEDLKAGVDFIALQLDRDRNAVPKPSEIDHLVSCIWVKALNARPELASIYFSMLSSNNHYRDIRHAMNYADDVVAMLIADQFTLKHGCRAFAIGHNATQKEIDAVNKELQRQVVFCNMTLLNLLYKSGVQQPLDEALSEVRSCQQTRRHFSTLMDRERQILESAIGLGQRVTTDLSMSMIDVISVQSIEPCCMEDGRIQVPDCWLQEDMAHRAGQLCTEGYSQCFCCEVKLCTMILDLLPDNRDKIVPELVVLPSNTNHPLMKVVHSLLVNASHKIPSPVTAKTSDFSAMHELCAEREKDLYSTIDKLKESHHENLARQTDEMRELLTKYKKLEKEVMANETKLVNEETRLQAWVEEKVEKVKKKAEQEINQLKLENQSLKLKSEDLENKLRCEEVHERREEALTDELLFYMEQCLHKSKALSKLSSVKGGEGGAATGGDSKREQLSEMLDMLTENLQRERFVCAVCLRRRKEVLLLPCQHYQLCEGCVKQIHSGTYPWCPTCKTPIHSYTRVYE